jgi:hypothetical protein
MKKYKIYCGLILFTVLLVILFIPVIAQDTSKKKSLVTLSGTMGITYEGYGLNVKPTGSNIYSPRRPWNQVRFVFTPTLKVKDVTIPFNFNFASIATNFAGPYAGLKKQSIGQFLTNPSNNFGINPKYKWAELLLGTQYLKYTELSTGDVGIFGAGFNLNPGKFLIKFFTGTSQQGVNFVALPLPGTVGAFKRTHYMFQLGVEVEGSHKAVFNFSKGKDHQSSVTSPPLAVMPQEGFNISLLVEKTLQKGWFLNFEAAQSHFTKDLNQPLNTLTDLTSFKPFITSRTSTVKDHAVNFSVGKKSKNFDISYATKYLGAGYQTMGYPLMQPDRWDNTINTRFNAWKNKMNVTASIGQRLNNLSNTSLTASQFLGNINWFTQFTDRFSLNVNYNNFGFQTASGLNPYGIKNVSNDLSINPSLNWATTEMSHMLTLNYNFSKYDERDVNTGITTSNNTQSATLTYIPVYFNKEITPDFSLLYFNNKAVGFKNSLLTLSSSLGMPIAKKKIQLRGQVQYTYGKFNSFTGNNNLVLSCNIDWKIREKLTWNSFLSTNYFKYGNELGLASLFGANYLESNVRTGLLYKF